MILALGYKGLKLYFIGCAVKYYLRNMKQPHMSICCDINMMGVVEHKRSLRGTQGVAYCFSDFSSALQLPECLYRSI
jgi:hypothetical protein